MDAAKTMRERLAAKGWGRSQVSVRKSGSTLYVKVKDLDIPLVTVTKIASRLGTVIHDNADPAEILCSPLNLHPEVEYDPAVFEPVVQALVPKMERALDGMGDVINLGAGIQVERVTNGAGTFRLYHRGRYLATYWDVRGVVEGCVNYGLLR